MRTLYTLHALDGRSLRLEQDDDGTQRLVIDAPGERAVGVDVKTIDLLELLDAAETAGDPGTAAPDA